MEPIVNPARWARQAVKDQACQNRADTKAFTGRGKLLELRQLLTELDVTVEAINLALRPFVNPLLLQHNLDFVEEAPSLISNLVLRSLMP